MVIFVLCELYLNLKEGKQRQLWPLNKTRIYCYDGEGNGNPLQYSCLENPRNGGAWLADGVAQSRTRLKHAAAAAAFPLVHIITLATLTT